MNSVQRRLGIGLFLTALVVGVAFLQVTLLLFENGLRSYLRTNLVAETEGLLIALVRGPDGLELDTQRINPAYVRPYSGRYFIIELGDHRWRSRSLWDSSVAAPMSAGMQADLVPGPDGQKLLMYQASYKRFGQGVSITVAQDYTPVLGVLQRVRFIGLGVGVLALLLLLVMQRLAVRRGLQPLEAVRRQIVDLRKGRRTELDANVPEELEPFVDQVNRLLVHTEERLRRSRLAIGDLGHALKTPLAVLGSLAKREELKAHPSIQARMIEQIEQIQTRLLRDLGRARLAGEALPQTYFKCAEELPALIQTLQLVHPRDLSITWDAPFNLQLPWDREDVLEMIGNLLDNACKWAQARVDLTIEPLVSGKYQVCVDDDGPGIDEASRHEVVARGTRLDEHTAGHGLGLGIVSDIVENVAGTLSLEDSPLGGLRVRITLPAPSLATRRQE
ncbi:ATP-binding protein [Pseudomonas sp. Marseille-QA0892]